MKRIQWRRVGRYVRVTTVAHLHPEDARALVDARLAEGYSIQSEEGTILPTDTESWLWHLAKTQPQKWMTLREITLALRRLGWYSNARNPEKWVGAVLHKRERADSSWVWKKRTPNGAAVYWLGDLSSALHPGVREKTERYYVPTQVSLGLMCEELSPAEKALGGCA